MSALGIHDAVHISDLQRAGRRRARVRHRRSGGHGPAAGGRGSEGRGRGEKRRRKAPRLRPKARAAKPEAAKADRHRRGGMWVVVGLGNPGAEYAHTRHNVGFMVVDALADRWRIALERRCRRPRSRVGRGRYGDTWCMLVAAADVYMNCSGEVLAVPASTADDHVVVVYDDLDLPAGRLRIRLRGGSGGHRGVASMLDRLRRRIRCACASASDARRRRRRRRLRARAARRRGTIAIAPDRRARLRRGRVHVTDGPAMAMNRFNAAPADSDADHDVEGDVAMIRRYETLMVLHPELPEAQVRETIDRARRLIEEAAARCTRCRNGGCASSPIRSASCTAATTCWPSTLAMPRSCASSNGR